MKFLFVVFIFLKLLCLDFWDFFLVFFLTYLIYPWVIFFSFLFDQKFFEYLKVLKVKVFSIIYFRPSNFYLRCPLIFRLNFIFGWCLFNFQFIAILSTDYHEGINGLARNFVLYSSDKNSFKWDILVYISGKWL